VRVKVKIKSFEEEKSIETLALVNAGYESEEPEITIPERVARQLGFFPELPKNSEVIDYFTVGGKIVRGYAIKKAAEVYVITDDRTKGPSVANVTIIPEEEDVILSDKLIDSLEIVIEKAGEGLWRFRDEKKIRKS
jgi:hypothetical protein